MKKMFAMFLLTGTLLVIVSMYFLYGDISPIDDISGCYDSPIGRAIDTVCIYPPDRIVQEFSIGGEETQTYNESTYRSFEYSSDEGKFVAVTMMNFKVVDSNGNVVSTRTFEIQPHRNTIRRAEFVIGAKIAGEKRVYLRR